MSSYAIFFDKDNTTYRLPTNPEKIEISSTQAIEKYEILKLGQIAIPTHMELKKYGFECEFPSTPLHYVETPSEFYSPDFYVSLFEEWRESKEPVRFIASNSIGDDINTLVLIEELTIKESAGEEGDKYISFKLVEYKKYSKKTVVVQSRTPGVATLEEKELTTATNPKSNGSHVVQSGDTLWAIAKKYYGDGYKYTVIYNANTDRIKNPNLIYPGQKLVIP